MIRAEALRLAQLAVGNEVWLERRRQLPDPRRRAIPRSRYRVRVLMPCYCSGQLGYCCGPIELAADRNYREAIENLTSSRVPA